MDPARLRLRESLYRALAAPFEFPDPSTAARFRSGDWQREVRGAARALGHEIAGDLAPLPLDDQALETEFIALFEVGLSGAPCPLHSGHYGRERMITLEEVVRFYQFFDFAPERSHDRMPDHLTTELTFMAHLAASQRTALEQDGDFLSPVRAQRDFLARHLLSWVPQLLERVNEHSDDAFFRDAVAFTSAFLTLERAEVDLAIGEPLKESGVRSHG